MYFYLLVSGIACDDSEMRAPQNEVKVNDHIYSCQSVCTREVDVINLCQLNDEMCKPATLDIFTTTTTTVPKVVYLLGTRLERNFPMKLLKNSSKLHRFQ